MRLLGRRGTISERSGPQSPPVTMEARVLWLLVVVLVLGSSSLAVAYQGLGEYCSDFLSTPWEGGGWWQSGDRGAGAGTQAPGSGGLVGARGKVTKPPRPLVTANHRTHMVPLSSTTNWILLFPFHRQAN